MSSAAVDLRRVAAALRTLPQLWVRDALKALDKNTKKALTVAVGADRTMSNVGRSGARLRTKSTQSGTTVVTGRFEPARPTAPWLWLEKGTAAHTLGGQFKGALHPGSPAKRTWTKGTDDPADNAMREADRMFDKATD